MRYLLWVLLAAILNGCIPYSDNPLTAPDKEGPDPAILGTWFLHEEGETVFLHMGINEKTKGLRVVMVEFQKDGEVKTSELIGHTSRLGNNTYMNLRWDWPADPEAGYLFVNPEEPIWMTNQFWGNYRQIFENTWEGKIKTFNTFKSGCFDSESLQKTLEANPGKQILLLNFPNNPAGYTPTIAEADAIVTAIRASAKRGNRIVAILDDAYFGLVYEPGVLAESLFSRLADLDERVLAVKLDGPTKEDYVWGFRVGFITFACKGISDETCRALEEKTAGAIRGTISNASHLSQSLILAGMRSPDYQDEKKRKFEILRSCFITVKSWLAKNKNRTENVFNPMPFNSGYFMCVELAPGLDAEAIRKNLLAKFDTGLISSGNTLRIAYSSLAEKDIPKVFENILAACREAD